MRHISTNGSPIKMIPDVRTSKLKSSNKEIKMFPDLTTSYHTSATHSIAQSKATIEFPSSEIKS